MEYLSNFLNGCRVRCGRVRNAASVVISLSAELNLKVAARTRSGSDLACSGRDTPFPDYGQILDEYTIADSLIDLFRTVHRPPGTYPKTGVMSGWATTHPEPRSPAEGPSGAKDSVTNLGCRAFVD